MKLFDIFIGRKKVKSEYMDPNGGFISRWVRPPSMNTAEWLTMFSKSPRLAVVDRIASNIANVGGRLFHVNADGSETEITKHPFLDFMEHPNPLYEMTSSAIWRLHEIYLLLVGESFFLIERDENEKLIELWNVPPHWVKMTPYLGNPYYQIISPSGQSMSVLVDDVFVMKQLNPLDPFMHGLGTAESVADEVEIDEYAAKFQKRFFYNDATPPVVFCMPDASSEQRDAFMARWNKKHRGVENSHRAAAFTGNVDVKVLGNNNSKNLDFIDSRIAMRDAVLEHFGVPREIMGITENSNRATADSAQYIYAKNVLTPRLRNREEAINKQLLPLFGDNLVWRFDVVIPYDKDFDKAKALDAYYAGIITKNEARQLLDLPEVESGGDVFKTGVSDQFLNMSGELIKTALPSQKKDIGQAVQQKYEGKSKHVNITAMLQKESKAIAENEKLFKAIISQHFAKQKTTMMKVLGLSSKSTQPSIFPDLEPYMLSNGTFDEELWLALSDSEHNELADTTSSGLLDWKEEAAALLLLFMPLWKKSYDDGASISQDAYKITNVMRPDFVSEASITVVNFEKPGSERNKQLLDGAGAN